MARGLVLVVLALAWGRALAQQAPAATAAHVAPIRVGFAPFLPADQMAAEFQPLADHLTRAVGQPVQFFVTASYADSVDAAVQRRFDVVYLTPACYVAARQRRPDLKLLLADVRSGLDFYTAVLVVRADDRFQDVEDLRGSRIVFVDRESTSGYVYPLRYLASLGLTPSQFREARFSGNHIRSLQMLLARETDVAAVSSTLLEGARDEGMDLSGVTILARAGVIPQHAVCSTGTLSADVEARLVEAMLAVTSLTDEGRRVLPRALRLNGFRRVEPSDYDDVERTMRGEETFGARR